MSAIPRAKRFVDPGVRVFRGLFARKFRLHPLHPGAKALSASRVFFGFGVRGGRLEPRLPLGFRFRVVRRAALGVQPALRVFAFRSLPRRSLRHHRSDLFASHSW